MADSIEDLVNRLNTPEPLMPEETHDETQTSESVDWLEHFDDSDTAPFPLDRPEDAPPAVRVMKTLITVSNVLRDSELVRDSALKQRVLQRALFVWGRFVALLEQDPDHQELIEFLVERLADDMGLSPKRKQSLLVAFREIGPLLTGFGSMSSTLASRKLSRSLRRCFSEESFQDDAPSLVMGALLALTIQDEGWASYFLQVGKKHPEVRVVRTALKGIAASAYYHQTLSRSDAQQLEEFLVDLYIAEVKSSGSIQKKDHRARLTQQLRKNRLRFNGSRLPAGETVYSARIEEGGLVADPAALPSPESSG